jgi:serine/threonine protein kinase
VKFNPQLTTAEVEAAFAGDFVSIQQIPNGEGGQGIVFKANPSIADISYVALKIYFPGSVSERAKREVEAMKRITCETLVKLHSSGHVTIRGQRCMFLATEFVNGELLTGIVARGPLIKRKAAQVGHDVALAIEAIWRARIVHRDIKPNNIMHTTNERSVLIDLGVARHLSMSPLTTLGKTWGTEGYMSPEQSLALRTLSCKSDIFSLGIVMQELFLGQHPTGYDQILLANGGIPTATMLPNLDVELIGLLDSMLRINPHLRPNPFDVARVLKKHL